jgi:hypothetical protein
MFQSSVAADIGFGVVGELFLDGPLRAQPGIIDSAGPNTVGFAFSGVAGADGHCAVGGAPAEGAVFTAFWRTPRSIRFAARPVAARSRRRWTFRSIPKVSSFRKPPASLLRSRARPRSVTLWITTPRPVRFPLARGPTHSRASLPSPPAF